MNKPTANYRMSSTVKTRLTLGKFKDAHEYGRWKRAMIDADIEATKKVKTEKTKD